MEKILEKINLWEKFKKVWRKVTENWGLDLEFTIKILNNLKINDLCKKL